MPGALLPGLGQGFKGGKNAAPTPGGNLFNPNAQILTPPAGTHVQPAASTQPIAPLAPPAPTPLPAVTPNSPQVVENTPANVVDLSLPGGGHEPLQYQGAAMLRRGSIASKIKLPGEKLSKIDKKAIKAINSPDRGASADLTTKTVILNPGPKLLHTINSDPKLAVRHNQAQTAVAQTLPVSALEVHHAVDESFKHGGKPSVAGAPLTAAQVQQSGFVPSGNKLTQILTEGGAELQGLGPGLAEAGLGFGKDLVNAGKATFTGAGLPGATSQDHAGNFDFSNTQAIGKNIAHSYGETIHHPGEQWKTDPLGLITNVASVPFLGAGGVARVGELGRAGELADAAGTSKLGQVARTLLRPRPQERKIALKLGGDSKKAMTITPPAYKSALGGLMQKHVLDPVLEKHLANPSPFDIVGAKVTNTLHAGTAGGKVGAAARFGRKARIDMENDIRIRAGALNARMPEDAAGNLARGTAFTSRWQQLHDSGVDLNTAAAQPTRDWTPIREPKTGDIASKVDKPEFLTPADLKNHPYLNLTDNGLAKQFDRGSSMIPSHDEEAENPDQFRYVPTPLIKSMQTYKAGTGHAAAVLNTIDRGTQLIRSGRFLTPAYAQWAAQNGLIHASQAGLMVFRNALQLRTEFSKLDPEVKGAIDGGMGKGIAKATTGEQTYSGPIAAKMAHIQHFWHGFNDQWARRMSAIHELNAEGYHDASAWTKLYKKNPSKFRKVVGGQGNREAINYTEMTPAERAIFGKLFTAYGWTRGASTFAARFPLQHPVQARVGEELGKEGEQKVADYYQKLGGMAPTWLQSELPFGKNHLLNTEWLSPSSTLGSLIQETPGATVGQTENLLGEAAPAPAAILQMLSGSNQFGTQYKGSDRWKQPIEGAISRFKPLSAVENMVGAKKGGTFTQGRTQGIEQLAGSPVSTLRDPTTTAGLGEKDYEEALSTPDKIRFQNQDAHSRLPDELAMYQHVTDHPLAPNVVSRLKGDYESVEQKELYQYHYAQVHGSKSWSSLPPLNKLNGTLAWMQDHGYPSAKIASWHHVESKLRTDQEMDQFTNELWAATGIGQLKSQWDRTVKGMKPPVLTKAH